MVIMVIMVHDELNDVGQINYDEYIFSATIPIKYLAILWCEVILISNSPK